MFLHVISLFCHMTNPIALQLKVSKKDSSQQKKAGLVLIYDATDLSPISRDLGMSYMWVLCKWFQGYPSLIELVNSSDALKLFKLILYWALRFFFLQFSHCFQEVLTISSPTLKLFQVVHGFIHVNFMTQHKFDNFLLFFWIDSFSYKLIYSISNISNVYTFVSLVQCMSYNLPIFIEIFNFCNEYQLY